MMTIGIICSLPQEYESIRGRLGPWLENNQSAYKISSGNVGKNRIALIRAGIGKVNAALAAAYAKRELGINMILSVGIAGILNHELALGDVVIGKEMCYHDCFRNEKLEPTYIDTILNMQKVFQSNTEVLESIQDILSTRLPGAPERIIKKTKRESRFKTGRIISGDVALHSSLSAQKLSEEYQALCVDMESAGVAQSCYIHAVPCAAVKVMSDYSDEKSYLYLMRYMEAVCTYLADVIEVICSGFAIG